MAELNSADKLILNYEDLKTKAGWYPLFVAPLARFDFYDHLMDFYEEATKIKVRHAWMTVKYAIAQGLPAGSPVEKLLLIDIDYIESFRSWITSYRLTDTQNQEYFAVTPAYAPLTDPIRVSAGRVDPLAAPVSIDIITYSGNKEAVAPIVPKNPYPAPEIINFVTKPPDPAIIKEAEAIFNPGGVS